MIISKEKHVSVTSWNIGYCGLGKEEELVADGGRRIFPKSRGNVEKNLEGIRKEIQEINSDIFLLQEIPKAYTLTRDVEVFKGIEKLFDEFEFKYFSEFKAKRLFDLDVGKIISSKYNVKNYKSHSIIPRVKRALDFIFRRKSQVNMAVFNITDSTKKLIVGNIHLSAFDKNALVRHLELKNLMKFIKREYKKGNHIIMGGDWNLVLKDIDFKHKTEKKYLFWIHKFPTHVIPDFLKMVSGISSTVRTNHQPYIKGDNFTTIIDGYMISSNIEVVNCQTKNLDFEFSDHNPVTLRFSLK